MTTMPKFIKYAILRLIKSVYKIKNIALKNMTYWVVFFFFLYSKKGNIIIMEITQKQILAPFCLGRRKSLKRKPKLVNRNHQLTLRSQD